MTLMRDTINIDFDEWVILAATPTTDDWLHSLWAIQHGATTTTSAPATTDSRWLHCLWGFSLA